MVFELSCTLGVRAGTVYDRQNDSQYSSVQLSVGAVLFTCTSGSGAHFVDVTCVDAAASRVVFASSIGAPAAPIVVGPTDPAAQVQCAALYQEWQAGGIGAQAAIQEYSQLGCDS